MDRFITLRERARRALHIRNLERPHQLLWREPVGRQSLGIHVDMRDPRLTTVDRDPGAIGDMLQLADDLFCHAVELVRVIDCAVQCGIHDRHIVNLDRLNNPTHDARRHLVHVLVELVV